MTNPLQRRWWLEAIVVLVGYQVYRQVRALVGGTTTSATRNAHQVIHAERVLGLFHERAVQHPFASHPDFLRFWDVYYGALHFAGPLIALVILYVVAPARYPHWRDVLVWVLLLALIGFAVYPVLPPRLLPPSFGFVDSGARYGGIGVLGRDTSAGAGNSFAAMPSLHLAWSSWTVAALWSSVRSPWRRPLLILFPLSMLYAVTVTANHYFLDAVGGVATVVLAYVVDAGVRRAWRRIRGRRAPQPVLQS